jgi:drug/metabolite transporter (DMT)-like permease
MTPLIAFILTGFMIVLTVFADWLIKKASMASSFLSWKFLLFGSIIYGLTGIGWFFVMRSIKLSTLGAIYGVGCILLLVLLSVLYFKESINNWEIFGIILAIISIAILARFG